MSLFSSNLRICERERGRERAREREREREKERERERERERESRAWLERGYRGYSKLMTHTALGPYGSSMPRSIGPS